MKSTINNNTQAKEKPFPKLMIDDESGLIVLFEKQCKGVVLTKGRSQWDEYKTSEAWNMPRFTDFAGSITLEND